MELTEEIKQLLIQYQDEYNAQIKRYEELEQLSSDVIAVKGSNIQNTKLVNKLQMKVREIKSNSEKLAAMDMNINNEIEPLIIKIDTTPFEYFGRIYRVIWTGVGRLRIQDNHGINYIITYQRFREMKLGLKHEPIESMPLEVVYDICDPKYIKK
jgi:hypothetical protein